MAWGEGQYLVLGGFSRNGYLARDGRVLVTWLVYCPDFIGPGSGIDKESSPTSVSLGVYMKVHDTRGTTVSGLI